MNIENPTEFWKTIVKLGPKKQHLIPMEVEDEHGNITDNMNDVFNRSKDDFASLLATEANLTNEQKEFVANVRMEN